MPHSFQSDPTSEGCRLLRSLHLSRKELQTSLRVGSSVVSYWLAGTITPRPATREDIERIYAIPYDAWDAAPGEYVPAPPKPSAAPGDAIISTWVAEHVPDRVPPSRRVQPPVESLSTLASCFRLLREIRDTADYATEDVPAHVRAALVEKEVSVLKLKRQIEYDMLKIKDIGLNNIEGWQAFVDGLTRCFDSCECCSTKAREYLEKSDL